MHCKGSKVAEERSRMSKLEGSEIHYRCQLSHATAAGVSNGTMCRRQIEAIRVREAEADRKARLLKWKGNETV